VEAELDVIHQQENAHQVYGDAQPAPIITHLPQMFARRAALRVKTVLFHGDRIIKLGVMGSFQLRRCAAGGWTGWIGDEDHCYWLQNCVVLTKLLRFEVDITFPLQHSFGIVMVKTDLPIRLALATRWRLLII
jgi:hypothetical protein